MRKATHQQSRNKGSNRDAAAQIYGPENPPRLRKPGESVEEYRVEMGWGDWDEYSLYHRLLKSATAMYRHSHTFTRGETRVFLEQLGQLNAFLAVISREWQ